MNDTNDVVLECRNIARRFTAFAPAAPLLYLLALPVLLNQLSYVADPVTNEDSSEAR